MTFAPRLAASSRASAPVPQPISRTRLRSGTSVTRRWAVGSAAHPGRFAEHDAIRIEVGLRITSEDVHRVRATPLPARYFPLTSR